MCDDRIDCIDKSDEAHCGTVAMTTIAPRDCVHVLENDLMSEDIVRHYNDDATATMTPDDVIVFTFPNTAEVKAVQLEAGADATIEVEIVKTADSNEVELTRNYIRKKTGKRKFFLFSRKIISQSCQSSVV